MALACVNLQNVSILALAGLGWACTTIYFAGWPAQGAGGNFDPPDF